MPGMFFRSSAVAHAGKPALRMASVGRSRSASAPFRHAGVALDADAREVGQRVCDRRMSIISTPNGSEQQGAPMWSCRR